MKNCYMGTEVIMLQPFEEYLKYSNVSFDYFLKCLEEKERRELEKLLKPLFHYGMISILIPLNEFLPTLLTSDLLIFWNDLVKCFDEKHIINDYVNSFHLFAVKESSLLSAQGIPYAWSFDTTWATMQSMVWLGVEKTVKEIIINNESMIGLSIPGFYHSPLNRDFLPLLDKYVFPYMFKELDCDADYSKSLNIYEKAVIKIMVETIAQELESRYYCFLSSRLGIVMNTKEEDFYKLRSIEFKKLLIPNDEDHEFENYITIEWTNSIDRLNHYRKLFSLSNPHYSLLDHITPILYQCVGLNENASELLIELLRKPDEFLPRSRILLIALYRAVAVERYDRRSLLYNSMKLLWGENAISTTLTTVIDGIVQFCKQISDEIPQRFRKETLKQLLEETTNLHELLFYYHYKRFIEEGIDYANIGKISQLSQLILENHVLVNYMVDLAKKINNTDFNYSIRLALIESFYRMFSMLTSKYDTEPRLCTIECLRILGIDTPQDSFPNELFNIYSSSQREQLKELHEQYIHESYSLPSPGIVAVFENLIFEEPTCTNSFGNEMKKAIERHDRMIIELQETLKESNRIKKYFLQYLDNDMSFNALITGVFVRNPDITREFCDEIYSLCKNYEEDGIQRLDIENLISIAKVLEEAISHPEHYYSQIAKEDFKNAINCICSCIPIVSTAHYATNAILSIKKGIERIEQSGL